MAGSGLVLLIGHGGGTCFYDDNLVTTVYNVKNIYAVSG